MKKTTSLALTCVFSLFASNSQAEISLYAGIATGLSSFDYTDVEQGIATKAFAGYRLYDNIAFEATLYDSGNADINSLPGVSLSSTGINIAGLYRISTSVTNLTVMVGGGFYNFETTVVDPYYFLPFNTPATEKGSGLSLAGGVELGVTKTIILRADIDMFFGVRDFANDGGINSLNLGIVLNF
ncbi:MAG: porin family protein [Gammaproteobacteria bacterium]|nr:porin family protein [Gammaproteobacteria bacterium]